MSKSCFLTGWLLLLCIGAWGQQPSDTLEQDRSTQVRASQFIVPATLLGAGFAGVWAPPLVQAKGWVREQVAYDRRGRSLLRIDDVTQYVPIAMDLGLGFAGVRARHRLRDRMLVTATSYAVMTLFVNSIKYSVCEPRPDTGAWNAFPSGHTAKAMTAAEIVRVEYGPWWGLGAYALGLGTAYLRLYNDRHWVNDVICGTGIGILSARIGYWNPACWTVGRQATRMTLLPWLPCPSVTPSRVPSASRFPLSSRAPRGRAPAASLSRLGSQRIRCFTGCYRGQGRGHGF